MYCDAIATMARSFGMLAPTPEFLIAPGELEPEFLRDGSPYHSTRPALPWCQNRVSRNPEWIPKMTIWETTPRVGDDPGGGVDPGCAGPEEPVLSEE